MSPFESTTVVSPVTTSGRRWLLLGAAMIALLLMHLLSGHDSAGEHRVLTPAAVTLPGAQLGQDTLVGDTSMGDSGPASGAGTFQSAASTGHGQAIVAGCASLLLAAAAVAFVGQLSRRRMERTVWLTRSGPLRGRPKSLSRLALCVERI